MKIVSTFRRKLKTSRKFVFENIMDLDHVCVLHRKWFSNLRIIVQQADYVEYRLTSSFYGLRQELLVRGAPIDHDRYWYEFSGPLAKIRVEGLMEGADGCLTLIERITYQFSWLLAPLFWLLRPLFKRQKQDILLADSGLLERVYELDQAGFRRRENESPRIVVYGGDGFFGRRVVHDLLNYSEYNILIASRHPQPKKELRRFENRVKFAISDIGDYDSVRRIIRGAKVVLCCIGPYQGLTLNLIRACIEEKVHYIDVADDRDFVARCHALSAQIKASGIAAFIGCSVVPGMSSLLTKFCLDAMNAAEAEKVKICITPGTRHPRGAGSFSCLLSTVGEKFFVLEDGRQELMEGWTGREQVSFPAPLGNRWVYFVVDIPDYFLQPIYFKTKTVEFKIGSELDFLNHCLSGIRWIKKTTGLRRLDFLAPLFRVLISLASTLGTSQGGLMVEVSRNGGEKEKEKMNAAVFASEKGEVIPAILPSIAVQMILRGDVESRGVIPLASWLPQERFAAELEKRQIAFSMQ